MSDRIPAVSVLMPCYNAASTVEEALDSLAAQEAVDFEIVAVDDGSTDGSREILDSREKRDARLRVLHQPHQGIIAALNHGLQACRGQYIARMDADDCSHPERLARQAALLDVEASLAVVSCLVRAFPAGQVRGGFQVYLSWLNSLITPEQISREIYVESPLAHPSVMFRREVVLEAGGYQEHSWPEDYDLWLRLHLHGARFAKVPQVLLDWRESPERLTRMDSRYALENFLRMKAYYLKRGPLKGRETVLLWGAGMMGRRLSKHLMREEVPVAAFFDIDPRKIGSSRRGLPVLPPADLPAVWKRSPSPVLIAAVGARGARRLIRQRLAPLGLVEGQDWWFAA